MRAFGKRVAELRLKRGLMQEQLAAKIDSHVTTIALIEGGTKFVHPLRHYASLHRRWDVEIKQLFEGVK